MPKFHIFCILLALQISSHFTRVEGLVEDVIDIIYIGREVVKTISSTWELADKLGVNSEIDLPFMKRKEKKIFSRMAELQQEFRKAEMTVRYHDFHIVKAIQISQKLIFYRLTRPHKSPYRD